MMNVIRPGSVRRARSWSAALPTATRSLDSEERERLGVGDPLAVERLVEDLARSRRHRLAVDEAEVRDAVELARVVRSSRNVKSPARSRGPKR